MQAAFFPVFLTLSVLLTMCSVSPLEAELGDAVRVDPGSVSTSRNEYNYQVVTDEDQRVFARADADFSNGKIMLSRSIGGTWSNPEKFIFSDERYKDSDPWFSADGHWLYFISDRPSISGENSQLDGYNIWRSRRVGKMWTAPEFLSRVNSRASEFGPQVHGDYLYFSSTREGKNGVYRAHLENGKLGQPELMPTPFHSAATDSDFTLSRDGRVAIWCSSRAGGLGKCDLYMSRQTKAGWTAAQNLGQSVNSEGWEFSPMLAPNGAKLYFASNRYVDGQDEGAADIYMINVEDVPVLQAAMSTAMKEQLMSVFGGESLLETIQTISFTLEMRSDDGKLTRADYIYDFARKALMRKELTGDLLQIKYVRGDRGILTTNGISTMLQDTERSSLLRGLELNFVNLLRHRDVQLQGPVDVTGHGDIQWYKLTAQGMESPLLGLDPFTGRIVEVGNDPAFQVLETDYLQTPGGLVWPHRFIIIQDGVKKREGRFSKVQINTPFPDDAPVWLTR